MNKIVVVSGHPDLNRSAANRRVLERLAQHFGGAAVIRRLDSLYPDYRIDVKAEQAALEQAGVIVLQFPIQWFNVPALLKKWLDDVLTHDFAYAHRGSRLQGKKLLLSFTAGGSEEKYAHKQFQMPAFMPAFHETANFTGMQWLEPLCTYGVFNVPELAGAAETARAEQLGDEHADKLIARLEALNAGAAGKQ